MKEVLGTAAGLMVAAPLLFALSALGQYVFSALETRIDVSTPWWNMPTKIVFVLCFLIPTLFGTIAFAIRVGYWVAGKNL